MGSYKETCAVSRSPIIGGQKVRLFFIASNKNRGFYDESPERASISKGAILYPWDDFKIIGSLGVKATYDEDEYGLYNFDENTIEAQHILSEIKKHYKPNIVSEKEEKYNHKFNEKNIGISKEDLNFSDIQRMISDGEIYINFYTPHFLNFVSIMAIHESVYQMLINDITEIYDPKISGYRKLNLEDVLNEGFEKYLIWKEEIETIKHKKIKRFNTIDTLKELGFKEIEELAFSSAALEKPFLENYTRDYAYMGVQTLNYFIDEYKKYPNETERSVVDKVNEGLLFSRKLQEYNIPIRPNMITGDDNDNKKNIRFLTNLIKTLKTIKN